MSTDVSIGTQRHLERIAAKYSFDEQRTLPDTEGWCATCGGVEIGDSRTRARVEEGKPVCSCDTIMLFHFPKDVDRSNEMLKEMTEEVMKKMVSSCPRPFRKGGELEYDECVMHRQIGKLKNEVAATKDQLLPQWNAIKEEQLLKLQKRTSQA